jgi:hypothetical protein
MQLPHLRISRISWHDLALTLGPYVLLVIAAFWFAYRFVRPAPPDTIVITSGRAGSMFATAAERYRKILAGEGITLKVLPSEGSLENLKRLGDPKTKVDVGFVQGGLADLVDTSNLMSLGSVFYEPVLVFYRSPRPLGRLSELMGKRIAIGREGSGTRAMATILLNANGIAPNGPTKLLDLEGKAAEDALFQHRVDAVFVMGDSAAIANIVALLHAPGIRLFDFVQGDAYVRRFRYLSRLVLPAGAFNLGKNLPPAPLTIVAPTVELVARSDLHPALSDMLIEAAREVHGGATLIQKAGEFPVPLEHEYRLSDDALRYYKTGKGFAYRHLPFWLASLVDRAVVMLVPIALLLIPGMKFVPQLYHWRVSARIYKRYGELMELERDAFEQSTPERRAQLLERLDEIEQRVITLKLPASFADKTYILRQHIAFVRSYLQQAEAARSP